MMIEAFVAFIVALSNRAFSIERRFALFVCALLLICKLIHIYNHHEPDIIFITYSVYYTLTLIAYIFNNTKRVGRYCLMTLTQSAFMLGVIIESYIMKSHTLYYAWEEYNILQVCGALSILILLDRSRIIGFISTYTSYNKFRVNVRDIFYVREKG